MTEAATAFRPRRGRPNASQAAAIERAILRTARAHFLQDGYDAVSMEGVASETGVSKGTLYARYPSKEALFTAVFEASVREWKETTRETEAPSPDLAVRLHQHARVIARSLVQPDVRAFQRLLLADRERFPALSQVMYQTGYAFIVALVADDIRSAAAQDGVAVRDADSVASLLVSALTGWQLQEGGGRDLGETDLIAFGARVVELLLAARPSW